MPLALWNVVNSIPVVILQFSHFSISGHCRNMSQIRVRALHDFWGANDAELNFQAGDIITVLSQDDPGWWEVRAVQWRRVFTRVCVGRAEWLSWFVPEQLRRAVQRPAEAAQRASCATTRFVFLLFSCIHLCVQPAVVLGRVMFRLALAAVHDPLCKWGLEDRQRPLLASRFNNNANQKRRTATATPTATTRPRAQNPRLETEDLRALCLLRASLLLVCLCVCCVCAL